MSNSQYPKPRLGYRYEFETHELEAARACVEAHGFAVLKRLLSDQNVRELCASVLDVVDPKRDMAAGASRTHTTFVEHSPALASLLANKAFLEAQAVFCGADELTLNRSAAIIRQPGSPGMLWHSDWCGFNSGPPKAANDVLNRGPWPSGLWLYITGSNPEHGGLAVIEDSHVADWQPPDGFDLLPGRWSFHRAGTEAKGYTGFDVPGLVPIYSEPGDEIVFAARTYHAAFPNTTARVRLSCGMSLRPRSMRLESPWPRSEAARAFVGAQPAAVQPMLENYIGFDPGWRSGAEVN